MKLKWVNFVSLLFTLAVCILILSNQTVFAVNLENKHNENASPDKKFNKQDTSRAIEYMKTQGSKKLEPVLLQRRPSPTLGNQFSVQPILFIANDESESTGNTTSINDTFQILKRWYSGALEQNNSGYTFRVADTVVYHAGQPISFYKCPNHETACDTYDGIWGNIQTELENAGYPIWTPGTSFVVFVKGAGGWAGSNCGPSCLVSWPAPGPASLDGFAILGDWALDAITGNVNNDCFSVMGTACYRDPQRGAIGHELGHTFGLAHALDQTGSLMYSWWDFPYTSLFNDPGNYEKELLRAESKFFSPTACLPNNQIDQITQPASVKTKIRFPVSFSVTNFGFCRWNAAFTDLHIVKDSVWGVSQVHLSGDIYPAQQTTFTMNLTAPALKGSSVSQTYNNFWQMRISNKYFGAQMGGPVTVTKL
jgi:hypothetical protein